MDVFQDSDYSAEDSTLARTGNQAVMIEKTKQSRWKPSPQDFAKVFTLYFLHTNSARKYLVTSRLGSCMVNVTTAVPNQINFTQAGT